MRHFLLRAATAPLFAATLFATLAHPALALESCPARSADERLSLIAAAPGCKAASRINDLCVEASGADTQATEAVIARCEKDFMASAPKSQIAAYQKDRAACEQKYAGKAGAVFGSVTGYCVAHAAVRYSGR